MNGDIVRQVKKVFELDYTYIGQVGVLNGEPTVIYFRIDDVEVPETDKPHGVAYTSDNQPPSIDNGDRIPIYTERIADNWFYYEKDVN